MYIKKEIWEFLSTRIKRLIKGNIVYERSSVKDER